MSEGTQVPLEAREAMRQHLGAAPHHPRPLDPSTAWCGRSAAGVIAFEVARVVGYAGAVCRNFKAFPYIAKRPIRSSISAEGPPHNAKDKGHSGLAPLP